MLYTETCMVVGGGGRLVETMEKRKREDHVAIRMTYSLYLA